MSPRIAIIGPGAVGAVMAARLGRVHEVLLCSRRPLAALVVETAEGSIAIRTAGRTESDRATTVDWILVATKAHDSDGAARWLPSLSGVDAPVAILQNGVEHRERFLAYLPADRIVPVVVECPAERPEPSRVRQRGPARLTVADDVAGRAFAALFAGTGVEVTLTPDLRSAAWRKLCVNAPGILSALLLRPAGVLHEEGLGNVARDLVREAIAVGRAEGAVLEDTLVESVLAGYQSAPADAVNSLLADRLAGRPMELDARNGAIVRLGLAHGIATPCNRMAVCLAMIAPTLEPRPMRPSGQ